MTMRPSSFWKPLLALAFLTPTILGTSWIANSCQAQAPYVAPDFYGDESSYSTGYRENKGQLRSTNGTAVPELRYYSERSPIRICLKEKSTVSFTFGTAHQDSLLADTLFRVDMKMVGNSIDPMIIGASTGDHSNYYIDTVVVEGALAYHRIIYENVADNVDGQFYYGSNGPRLAFVLKPGAIPASLRLQFTGQDSLHIDWQGALRMYKHDKWIRLEQAVGYQVGPNNGIIPVNWTAAYVHEQGTSHVRFGFGDYDPQLPLVLQIGYPPSAPAGGGDPPPCWSTYFGGSSLDVIHSSTTDGAGNYYVAGYTLSPAQGFPVNQGSEVQVIGANQQTLFLSRFDNVHALLWTNYYGAPGGNEHHAHDIAVRDDPFAIYLVGRAPAGLVTPPNGSAYMDNTPNSTNNGFIARFDQNGILQWATYFGNVLAAVHSAAIDAEGRLLIAGIIGQEVPEPTGGQPGGAHVQAYVGGPTDGYIAAFDENDDLRWTTCLGGSSSDMAWAARTVGQRIRVAGDTHSSDFEPIEPGGGAAYPQDTFGGAIDLFILEFDLDGALERGTYYGTADAEVINTSQAVRMDDKGDLAIAASGGANLDVVPGPGWHQDQTSGAIPPQLLVRFSGPDRSLDWATYLPNSVGAASTAYALAFDHKGNLFVAGTISGTQLGPVELAGLYYQEDPNSISTIVPTDGFIMCFTPDHWLAWNTYFGGDDQWGGSGLPFESIRSLACSVDVLYAAGVTIKYLAPPDSYFPLHNPGSGAWYEGAFSGVLPNPVDGFIAAFCTELLTSVDDRHALSSAQVDMQCLGNDLWRVSGLNDGRYYLRLFDSRGREVHQGWIMVAAMVSEPFSTASLPSGTYLAVVDGPARVAFKVPVVR